MVRSLGHCGPKVCEILHLPQLKSKQHLFFKKRKKNPDGKRPIPREVKDTLAVSLLTPQHSRTTRVLLAGILTSLYSSGSSGPLSLQTPGSGVGPPLRSGGVEGSAKGYTKFRKSQQQMWWASPHKAPWVLLQGFMPRVK